ncbi:MAG TPA: peptide ABC transporter substrate-binding protein [Chloroflexota bacterium]|nr:peptide ABC transporter substrate-binding protein [Chloroflexota bacterium]
MRRQLVIVGLTLLVIAAILRFTGPRATGRDLPAAGGVYVEGVVGHPARFNPLLSDFNEADNDVVSLVFSGLTRVTKDGSLAPDLAENWSVSPDGKVYTFVLRAATWSDGQPVTADDVLYTVTQIQSPGFPGSPELARLWKPVKVAKVDARTVTFTLSEPYAPFPQYTTLRLLPAHLLGGVSGRALVSNQFNAKPVGTGPFVVQSADLHQVVLVPNPHYAGQHPYLDGITFKYFDTSQAALDALKAGQVQGLGNVPADHLAEVTQNPRVTLLRQPDEARINTLILNTQSPFFSDASIRRALGLAIDRTKVIQAGAGGLGVSAAGPIPPGSWAYAAQSGAYSYDAAQAGKLLDAAGWTVPSNGGLREKGGKAFRFALLAVDQPDRVREAQEISRQLRLVGIQADVQTANWSTIVSDFLAPHHFEAALTDVYSPSGDPDPYPFWDSSQIQSGLNVANWSNSTADKLLEEARQSSDLATRRADYARFQELFAQEQPSILLYYPVYAYAVPSSLKGVSLDLLLQPADRFATVNEWYIREEIGDRR